jgi:hypothetical protein
MKLFTLRRLNKLSIIAINHRHKVDIFCDIKHTFTGSLVCAVLIAAQFIDPDDRNASLSTVIIEQLGDHVIGLEINPQSTLPYGSGMCRYGRFSIMI